MREEVLDGESRNAEAGRRVVIRDELGTVTRTEEENRRYCIKGIGFMNREP